MKKYFLTTALMGTFIAPAFGADKIITSENTCTVDVLGVSDNNAVANTIATWDAIEYTLDPGEYLSVTETSVHKAPCPSGSYCGGGTEFTVNNAATSIATCPPTHPNSAEGAGADTQCYTACTVANANIAHATAVTGNDYFGTGTDTCGATACETGYHVDGGGIEVVEKTPLAPISLTDAGAGYRYVMAGGTRKSYGTVDAIPADSVTAPNTWAVAYSEGVLYGKASCQPKRDPALEYQINNSLALMGGQMSLEDFLTGLEPLAGPVKTEYVKNTFIEYATGAISEEEANKRAAAVFYMEPNANYSTSDTGQYCYCQMDGFMPTGGTKEIVTSAPWVSNYGGGIDSVDICASACAYNCVYLLQDDSVDDLAMRAAVVGALEAVETGGICAANTINIKWDPANKGAVIENQCTYDGAITVPADPVKPGFTFAGWKLLEETTTE